MTSATDHDALHLDRAVPREAAGPFTAPRPATPSGRTPTRRRDRTLVLALATAGLVAGATGCGSGDDGDAQRKVVTTDAGTVIVRTVTGKDALKEEAQDSSLYASFTKDTPQPARSALQGSPLAVTCVLRDGRSLPAFQLLWRADAKDWGASLEVQGAYTEKEPFAAAVRTCTVTAGADRLEAAFTS